MCRAQLSLFCSLPYGHNKESLLIAEVTRPLLTLRTIAVASPLPYCHLPKPCSCQNISMLVNKLLYR